MKTTNIRETAIENAMRQSDRFQQSPAKVEVLKDGTLFTLNRHARRAAAARSRREK